VVTVGDIEAGHALNASDEPRNNGIIFGRASCFIIMAGPDPSPVRALHIVELGPPAVARIDLDHTYVGLWRIRIVSAYRSQ
jgi:hypothetical protein